MSIPTTTTAHQTKITKIFWQNFLQDDELIPGVSDAGAIAIFISIGFVLGILLTACIFFIRHCKARKVDHEFRERFGSPLAAIGNTNNPNNNGISQQQQDVSLLLHAAAAPAYPEPIPGGMNTLYIPQKPPLLPKTMDMLSKAGPLGYSITSLRDSISSSEAANNNNNNPHTTNNPSNEALQNHPGGGSTLIPAYFGGQKDTNASQGNENSENSSGLGDSYNSYIDNSNKSSSIGSGVPLPEFTTIPGGLDASASVIIREEGPPNAATNVFRSPLFVPRKDSSIHASQENVERKNENMHGVAAPPVFIAPPKGLSTIGPLARSVSNLHVSTVAKSCPTQIPTTTSTSTSISEEKKEINGTDDGTNSTTAGAEMITFYENPFATTSAAKAAHEHALLELEAAEKQELVFNLQASTKGGNVENEKMERGHLNTQLGSNPLYNNQRIENGVQSSGKYNKPGTKVTPKRGMAGIEEVAQVLDKKLENATEDNDNVEQGGGEVKEEDRKDKEKDDLDVELGASTLRGSMVSPESSFRSATPSKQKAE